MKWLKVTSGATVSMRWLAGIEETSIEKMRPINHEVTGRSTPLNKRILRAAAEKGSTVGLALGIYVRLDGSIMALGRVSTKLV